MVATHDLNMYNLMRGFLGSAVPTSALRAATDWIPVLRNPRLVLGTGVSAPATSAWSSGGSSAAIGSNNLADYSGSCTSCHHTEPAWPPQAGPCSVSVQLEEWAVMTGLRRYPEYRGILTDGLYARADVVFSSSSNMGMMLAFIPRILGRPQSEITRRLSVGSEVFVPLSGSMNERLEASYIQATFAPLVGGNGFSPPSLISRVGTQVVQWTGFRGSAFTLEMEIGGIEFQLPTGIRCEYGYCVPVRAPPQRCAPVTRDLSCHLMDCSLSCARR